MNLHTLQQTAQTLIATAAAIPGNALAGVITALESPTEDLAVTIEPALAAHGAAIAIRYPSAARSHSERQGSATIRAELAVDLITDPVILTGTTGLNTDPLEIIEALWRAIAGGPSTPGPSRFSVAELPLELLAEEEGGLLYYRANFEGLLHIANP